MRSGAGDASPAGPAGTVAAPGAAIVEPTWGEVVAGPLRGEEGMVIADCDLRAGLHAKRWFDAVGHYSRADVLDPPAAPGAATVPAGPAGEASPAPDRNPAGT